MQNNIACEGGGSGECAAHATAIKMRSGWRGPFAVWGFSAGKLFRCGAKAASTGASRRTNCREWSGYYSCGVSGDAGGGADSDDVVAYGVGLTRLSERSIIRGSDEWCVLIPLNP